MAQVNYTADNQPSNKSIEMRTNDETEDSERTKIYTFEEAIVESSE